MRGLSLSSWLLLGAAGLAVSAVMLEDGDGGVRDEALRLCALYLPCTRGDAHFNEITKDYGGVGTTCGYLPSWMLYRLGCRDPGLVNRIEPGLHDEHPLETIGENIARLVQNGHAPGFHWIKSGRVPKPGDILYFGVVSAEGGISHEHVAVLAEPYPPGGTGTVTSFDLGHSVQPEGSLSERVAHRNRVTFFGGSQKDLLGFVDLDAVPFEEDPDRTDHTV